MSNAEITKRLYRSFGSGDLGGVIAALSPDIEWREAEGNPYQMDGKPFVGADAVLRKLLVKIGEDWEGFTVIPESFYEAGQTVIVEGRYTGEYKATGRRLDAQVCHVWKLEDGTIKSLQQYTDTAQLQRVMGRPRTEGSMLSAPGEESDAGGMP